MAHLQDRTLRWLVAALCALPLAGFWAVGLFDLDEGFYGAVVGEMLRRGEWVTPFYNGQPWFEKPILLYWLAKPTVAAFGPWVGPKLPSVLAALALYAAVYRFAQRHWDERTGLWAALALSSSLLMVGLGRMMMTDALLTLFVTLAAFTFFDAVLGRPLMRGWTAFFLGLSVLAKGPVGCLLLAILAILVWWRQPELRPGFRGGWTLGVIVLVATVSTWYVPAYLADGDLFVQEFLIKQNLGRFLGGDVAHTIGGPLSWLFFVPILLVGMAPWSFWILRAWPRRPDPMAPDTRVLRYLATWAAVVFVFFSVSGAKLPHYIVPCLPPLAILVGRWIARRIPAEKGLPWWAIAWPVAACAVANAAFLAWYDATHREVHQLALWAKSQGGELAVYQMSRRTSDRGTGKAELQETSHPSVVFYMDRVVPDAEDLAALERLPRPVWILTRANRISESDRQRLARRGLALTSPDTARAQDRYRLFRLEDRR